MKKIISHSKIAHVFLSVTFFIGSVCIAENGLPSAPQIPGPSNNNGDNSSSPTGETPTSSPPFENGSKCSTDEKSRNGETINYFAAKGQPNIKVTTLVQSPSGVVRKLVTKGCPEPKNGENTTVTRTVKTTEECHKGLWELISSVEVVTVVASGKTLCELINASKTGFKKDPNGEYREVGSILYYSNFKNGFQSKPSNGDDSEDTTDQKTVNACSSRTGVSRFNLNNNDDKSPFNNTYTFFWGEGDKTFRPYTNFKSTRTLIVTSGVETLSNPEGSPTFTHVFGKGAKNVADTEEFNVSEKTEIPPTITEKEGKGLYTYLPDKNGKLNLNAGVALGPNYWKERSYSVGQPPPSYNDKKPAIEQARRVTNDEVKITFGFNLDPNIPGIDPVVKKHADCPDVGISE